MDNTNDQTQAIQILYEISMSIGTSLNLRTMLKTSVSTLLKKLNCIAGGVYLATQESDGTTSHTLQYAIPRTPERNKTYRIALEHLPQAISPAEYDTFLAGLPLTGQSETAHFYHILNLPGFGLLILLKNRNPLEPMMLKSLQPLLNKMAAAALACQTEHALRQSEERYRLFTETTFDGIVIHQMGIIQEINPSLANQIGYDTQEIIGMDIMDVIAPEYHEITIENVRSHNDKPYELEVVRQDGSRFPIEVIDRDYYEDGERYRVTAVRDLTTQKQLESELAGQLERRSRQMRLVTQVAQTIAEAANLDTLYQRIVREVKEQFVYYHTQLFRYDPALGVAKLTAGYGKAGKQMLAEGHQLPIGEGLVGAAAATGKSVLRSDLTNDPDWRPNPHLPNTKGEIAVPIKLRDQVLGVLDVQSSQAGDLTNDDQLLLEGLCGQIAVAIDSTRLTAQLQETTALQKQQADALRESEQSLQELLEKQRILHEIGNQLSQADDLDTLYRQVVKLGCSELGFDRLGLFLLDDDGESIVGTYGIGPNGNLRQEYNERHELEVSPWWHDLLYNQERLMVSAETPLYEGTEVIGRGWHVVASLWVEDTPLGLLFADNLLTQKPLKSFEPEVLSSYASTIANLIMRTRVDEALRQSEERFRILFEKSADAYLIIEDNVFTDCNQTAVDMLRATSKDEVLLLHPSKLSPERQPDGRLSSEKANEMIQIALEKGGHHFEWMHRRTDGEDFPAAVMLTSIHLNDKEVILTVWRDITADKQAQAANAKRAAELQTVADLSTQAAAIQDPQELLEAMVQETQQRFNLYHCHIFLMDEQGKTLRVQACGWHEDAPQHSDHGDSVISIEAKRSLVAQAARSRQAVVVNDVRGNPDWLPNELLPDTRSEMAVPMVVGNTVIGVLDIQAIEANRFSVDDMRIHTTLASQIAVSLENVRSLQRTQQAINDLNTLTRRLTREGWDSYLAQSKTNLEFTYESGDIQPTATQPEQNGRSDNGDTEIYTPVHSQPLTIHGEQIGQLDILDELAANPNIADDDAAEIIAIVAAQLSARIENIRLSEQTQSALSLTEQLYTAGSRINTAGADLQEAVAAINEAAPISVVNRAILFIFEYDARNKVQAIITTANWYNGTGYPPAAIGTRYEWNAMPTLKLLVSKEPLLVDDALHDERLDPTTSKIFKQLNIQSLVVLPLWVGSRQIGALLLESEEPHHYTEQEVEPYIALNSQLAIAVDRQRLLNETAARAERERKIRTITDKIRKGADRESILQIAREEIGAMLGAKTAVAQLGTQKQLIERLHHHAKSVPDENKGTP